MAKYWAIWDKHQAALDSFQAVSAKYHAILAKHKTNSSKYQAILANIRLPLLNIRQSWPNIMQFRPNIKQSQQNIRQSQLPVTLDKEETIWFWQACIDCNMSLQVRQWCKPQSICTTEESYQEMFAAFISISSKMSMSIFRFSEIASSPRISLRATWASAPVTYKFRLSNLFTTSQTNLKLYTPSRWLSSVLKHRTRNFLSTHSITPIIWNEIMILINYLIIFTWKSPGH